ncbi:MAG: hypothetical protein COB83_10730 [Gammaproteobacteria bacterium]|nr:MAG: hypothetical protein COB83_10730 [Gammaproteobacteria bacterium]
MTLKFKRSLIYKSFLATLPLLSLANDLHASELEVIEVTARKRVENMQEVPVSISAFTADELNQAKLRDTTEIANLVPNMQISTPMGDSMPVISMRGISMDDFSLNQSSPVAMYVDEVYKGNPALQSAQMYDLERLEVLRGPQGTLYGKNSTGGAVNFITRKANFNTEGYLTLGLGTENRKEAQGAFQTEIIEDKLAMRVAGTWLTQDGWKVNHHADGEDTNAIDEWATRVSFTYQPVDNLEMLLRLSSSKSTPINYGYSVIPNEAGAGAGLYELFNNDSIGLPAALGVTPPANAPQYSYYNSEGFGLNEINESKTQKRNVTNDAISMTINWDISSDYSLTSITSWDQGEFYTPEGDGTPNKILEIDYWSDADQVSQDLRLTSNLNGKFNFIVGMFYSKEEISSPTNIPAFNDVDFNVDGSLDVNDCADPILFAQGLGEYASASGQVVDATLNYLSTLDPSIPPTLAVFAGLGCQLRNDFDQTRTSLAGYFDGSYELTDALTARLGVRYTSDETTLENFEAAYYGSDNVLFAQTITQESLIEDKIEDQVVTGKVGLDYQIDDSAMVYVNASRGYRNAAFNSQAFNAPFEVLPVKPEYVNAYEIGFKSELFDHLLRLNGAAFYYDYQNQQLLDIDPANATQRLVNIDSSTITGLELELIASVTEDFLVTAGLGLLDTKIEEGTVKGVDLKGNELTQAPKANFNLNLDYYLPLTDIGNLRFNLSTTYIGEQYFDVLNSELIKQEAYWLSNGKISFINNDETYNISLWVKNITDEEYMTKPFDFSDFGMVLTHMGTPRSAGIEITVNFE